MILNIADLIGSTITIRNSSGDVVNIPWSNTPSAILLSVGDLNSIKGLTSNTQQTYIELKARLNTLRSYINDDYNVRITTNKESKLLVKGDIDSISELIDVYLYDEINVNSILEGSFRLHNPKSNVLSRGIIPGSEALKSYAQLRYKSEVQAEEALLGDPNVSLQIGYLTFDDRSLGPDSVVFADISNVSATPTIRSDSEIVMKQSGGHAYLEIDIIFHNTESINNKLRQLIGLLKMAPIIPVGGSAINSAFINIITASEVYKVLRDQYFSIAKTTKEIDEETLQKAMTFLEPQNNLTLQSMLSIYRKERASIDILKQTLETERANKAREDKANKETANIPDLSNILRDQSIRQFLIPLAFDSITISTIPSAPGALRARLTFQRIYDPYAPVGGLTFLDEFGDPTVDIMKCRPLMDAVNVIYLSPDSTTLQILGDRALSKPNRNYIAKIGEKPSTDIQSKVVLSEEGHSLYKNPVGNNNGSPVLFRFSTPQDPAQIYEYIPDDMLLNNVSWVFNQKFAAIPIEGSLYPAYQHMGRSSVTANLSFSTVDRKAIQKFFAVKSSMDQHNTSEASSSLFRREFCDVYNDVLNLCGYNRFLISSARMETDPDNPGLYNLSIELISNQDVFRDRETIELKESGIDLSLLKAFWWWLYAGIVIKFLKDNANASNLSGLDSTNGIYGNIIKSRSTNNYNDIFKSLFADNSADSLTTIGSQLFQEDGKTIFGNIGLDTSDSSHTISELENIWALVFGRVDESLSPTFVEGIMENNIFLAAFLQVMMDGEINIPISQTSIFNDKFKQLDNISNYFSIVTRKAREGGEGKTEYLSLKGGVDDKPINISSIIELLQAVLIEQFDSYTKNGDTPWWFVSPNKQSTKRSDPFIEFGSGSIRPNYGIQSTTWLEYIKERLIDGPGRPNTNTGKIVWSFLKNNIYGANWIPTPTMWAKTLEVIMGWRKLASNKNRTWPDGSPEGYYIQRAGFDGPAFILTTQFRTMQDQLTVITTNPSYKQYYPSFWKRRKGDPTSWLSSIDVLNNKTIDDRYSISPIVYENRNNYIDIPLPRYSDIFSDGNKEKPVPRTDISGYEVWRKVAPSYLELGQSPDIFEGAARITESNTINPKSPLLATPRSFFDYCDPGFFYYKLSWLVENHDRLHDSINNTEEYNPLGSENNQSHSLTLNEQALYKQWNKTDNLRILKTNFTLKDKINRQTYQNISDSLNEEHFGKWLSKELKDDIIEKINTEPYVTSKQKDLESINDLLKGKINRILVVDGTDRQIGLLVKGVKGKNDKKINVIDLNKQLGNTDPNVTINFVDLSSSAPKKPRDISYVDGPGVFRYNPYRPADAASIYKKTLEHAADLKQNHVRAYPTFRLYFVREKLVGNSLQTYLEDDMYGYSSVISIDVITDKNDAAVAKIQLTDISGTLSTSEFLNDVYNPNTTIVDTNINYTEPSKTTNDYNTPSKLKLEIGTNILIKMGYGNDPDSLPIVFTGAIAEIEPGPITNIVAQGYKTELFRYVNFYTGSGIMQLAMDSILHRTKNPIASNYLTYLILSKLGEIPGVSKFDSMSGIPHLGRFLSLADFNQLGNNQKDEYTNKYLTTRDSKLNNGAGALDYIIGTALFGRLNTPQQAANKFNKGYTNFTTHFAKYSSEFMHTNAMRNVWWSDEPSSDRWLDVLSREWLVNSTGWEALKEITRYRPGYVTDVLPYGTRATLFIGKPDQLYHYKPVDRLSQYRYENAIPTLRAASFGLLFKNILNKFFKSNEFGFHNIEESWRVFQLAAALGNYVSGIDLSIKADLSLQQFAEKLSSILDQVNKPSLSPLDINRLIPLVSNINILPSYAISRYVINNLKKYITDRPLDKPEFKMQSIGLSDIFNRSSIGRSSNIENISYYGNGDDNIIFIPIEDKYRVSEELLSNTLNKETKGFAILDDSIGDIFTLVRGLEDKSEHVRPKELSDLGYQAGDYWAITRAGNLVPANILRSVFNIDPTTGKPFGQQDNTPGGVLAVATQNSYGAYSRHNVFVERQPSMYYNFTGFNKNPLVPVTNLSSSMLLIDDRYSDLSFIRSYGRDFDKLLFAVFFGLIYNRVKDGDEERIEFLNLSNELEAIWPHYNEIIMKGIHFNSSLIEGTQEQQLQSLNEALSSTTSGLFSSLNIETNSIKYGDILYTDQIIDSDLLKQAADIFNVQLKDAVIKGQVSTGDINKYQKRLSEFLSLASSGQLASSYVNKLGEVSGILDSMKDWTFKDIQHSILDTKNLDSFNTTLTSTDQKFNLARGNINDTLFSVLISNADDYKLFLMFFAKWLRASAKDKDLAPAKTIKAISDLISKSVPPGMKRFADVHYIVSGIDIVENTIKATMSDMANNILLLTSKEIEIETANDPNSPEPIYTFNETKTDYIPYPNYQYSGVDYHPFVRPELRKQRKVIERNAESDNQRAGLLITHMAEAIRPMYRGHLKVIGKNIKPYDKIILIDTNKDMYGVIEAERVLQSFDAEGGWTTTIIPHAWVNALDQFAQVVNKFDTSNIDIMLSILNVADWMLDAFTIMGVIRAPAAAASVAASTALKDTSKGLIKNSINLAIKKIVGTSISKNTWAFRRQAAAILAKSGKSITTEAEKKIAGELALKAATKSVANTQAFLYSLFTGAGLKLAAKRALLIGGAGGLGLYAGRKAAGIWTNISAEMKLKSALLPIHTYCLTRYGQPLQAGLDMNVTSFFSWSERFGISVDNVVNGLKNFVSDSFTFDNTDLRGDTNLIRNSENR